MTERKDYPLNRQPPGLKHNQTIDLIKQFQATGDPAVKAAVIAGNMGLVRRLAGKYRTNPSQEYWDFVAEGSIGLNRAVEKFDIEKGYRFSTYATFWIRQAISDSISKQSRTIVLPDYLTEHQGKIHKFIDRGRQENGETPTVGEICAATNLQPKQVRWALSNGKDPLPLDNSISEDSTFHSVIAAPEVANDLDQQQTREYLERALAKIDQIDRDILFQSIGFSSPKIPLRTISANHGRVGTRYATQHRDNAINRLRLLVDRDAIGW